MSMNVRKLTFVSLFLAFILSACGAPPPIYDEWVEVGGSVPGRYMPSANLRDQDDNPVDIHDFPESEIILHEDLIILDPDSSSRIKSQISGIIETEELNLDADQEEQFCNGEFRDIPRPIPEHQPPTPQVTPSPTSVVEVEKPELESELCVGEIAFWFETEQLSEVSVGDYVSIQPPGNGYFPHGTLRQVIEIGENADGDFVLKTIQAHLTDVVLQGTIKVNINLQEEDLLEPVSLSDSTAKRAKLAARQAGMPLRFNFDQSYSDANGTANMHADFEIEPEVELLIDIGYPGILKTFAISSTIDQYTLLQVDAQLTGSSPLEIDKSWPLGVFGFEDILVDLEGLILIFTPEIDLKAGIDGTLIEDLDLTVTQETSTLRGVGYQNNQWFATNDLLQAKFTQTPVAPQLSGTGPMNVRTYVTPSIGLLLYGITGPFVGVEAYYNLRNEPIQYDTWELHGGYNVIVGISFIDFLFIDISMDAVVFNYDKLLASYSPSLAGATPSANPQSVIPNQPGSNCPDQQFVQFAVNMQGTIRTSYIGVNLRSAPYIPANDHLGNVVAGMYFGDRIEIIDGPACAYNGTWWKVRTAKNEVGWAREYWRGEYLFQP